MIDLTKSVSFDDDEEEEPCKCKLRDINTSRSPIIWVIGGPGSQKRRYAEKIAEKYEFEHLSVGDLIKESGKREIPGERKRKTVDTVIQHGGLVPTEFVIRLLNEAMSEQADIANGYVIHGFPREKTQAKAFQKKIGLPAVIFYLEVSKGTMLNSYVDNNPEQLCKVPNLDEFMDNIKCFLEITEQVLALFPTKVRRIDATRPVRDVFKDVSFFMDPIAEAAQRWRDNEKQDDSKLRFHPVD